MLSFQVPDTVMVQLVDSTGKPMIQVDLAELYEAVVASSPQRNDSIQIMSHARKQLRALFNLDMSSTQVWALILFLEKNISEIKKKVIPTPESPSTTESTPSPLPLSNDSSSSKPCQTDY